MDSGSYGEFGAMAPEGAFALVRGPMSHWFVWSYIIGAGGVGIHHIVDRCLGT